MECPHCGAAVPPGSTFCMRCRKRVVAPSAGFNVPAGSAPAVPRPPPPAAPPPAAYAAPAAPPPPGYAAPAAWSPPSASGARADITAGPGGERFRRPGGVTALAILDLVGGAFCLLGGMAVVAAGFLSAPRGDVILMLILGGVYLLLGFVQVIAGVGLLKLMPFGRGFQIGLSIVGLLGIPLGTIISIVVLVYMFKPGVKLLFSGRAPHELTSGEQDEVARAMTSSGLVVAVVIIVVLLGVAMVGMIAAIAIPSLLRARVSANESSAIGDLRSVISAEVAYAASNGGFYDRLPCLMKPGDCIPRYPAGAPYFIDPSMAQTPRHGYVFTFHEGPRPAPGTFDPSQVSPTSLTTFAYTAVPVQPGQTGVRAFCGDATGRICYSRNGPPPGVEAGACAADCTPLQ